MNLKKYFSAWNLLYFVIGLTVLYILLRKVDFTGLVQLVLKIPPTYLLLAGGIYFLKALTRAFRFTQVNARSHPAYLRMLRLSLASSLASQILPLKLGELSYVYLLNKENRSSVAQGISTLMVIRIYDLLGISLLFLAISITAQVPQDLSIYFYSILWFVAALLIVILSMLLISRNGEKAIQFAFHYPWVARLPLADKLRRVAEGMFHTLNPYQWPEYLEWTGLSMLEWLINFGSYHAILVGMGLSPSFFATVTAVTFAALASVLPINSFGSFGTQEAGWATGMVLLGFPQTLAISTSFAVHLLSLGYMLIFGGLAWLSYLVAGRFSSKSQPASY